MAVSYRKKSMLPRGLLARLMLIFLVPLVLLQIIIGLMFVQRHFDEVSSKMSEEVANEIRLALQQSHTLGELQDWLELIDIDSINNRPPLLQNNYRLFDISGRAILRTFRDEFVDSVLIDSDFGTSNVRLIIPSQFGDLDLMISRYRLAPSNPHQLLVAMVLSSIILFSIALLFLRNQIRAIRKLSRAAESYGRNREYHFTVTGADEIRTAGHAFIAMRDRIDRQRRQRMLMLSGVSHDIKTPLTRMRLNLSLLDDEDVAMALGEDIAQIEALTQSFLDYAALDHHEQFETIYFPDFIARLRENYPEVDVKIIPDIRDIQGKPLLLSRAIENLLENAKTYGNTIRLRADIKNNRLEISVEDDGPGIPEEKRAEAILAFHRLDAARNLNLGAHSGLGLALVQDVANQHGGTFQLTESAALGGLKAVLNIPYALS